MAQTKPARMICSSKLVVPCVQGRSDIDYTLRMERTGARKGEHRGSLALWGADIKKDEIGSALHALLMNRIFGVHSVGCWVLLTSGNRRSPPGVILFQWSAALW